jgi:nicotinamidase/pyrazinamidase
VSPLERAALLLVDLQIDFLPGGALAVAGGDTILEPIRELAASGVFPLVVATQDWHPRGHVSFASSHTGRKPFDAISLHGEPQMLWPDHCIAGSAGAALHPRVPSEAIRAIVRKGTDPGADAYSGFRDSPNSTRERRPTGLRGFLTECGVRDVYVCGLARDYCVSWTALDAADLGFTTTVIWDLTRPVNAAHDADTECRLRAHGVSIVESSTLPAAGAEST